MADEYPPHIGLVPSGFLSIVVVMCFVDGVRYAGNVPHPFSSCQKHKSFHPSEVYPTSRDYGLSECRRLHFTSSSVAIGRDALFENNNNNNN